MTKTDPNRTPCDDGFAAAVRHFALAGACRIISRLPETDDHSTWVLKDTASFHSRRGHLHLSLLTDEIQDGF